MNPKEQMYESIMADLHRKLAASQKALSNYQEAWAALAKEKLELNEVVSNQQKALECLQQELNHTYEQLKEAKSAHSPKFGLENFNYGHAVGYLKGYEDGATKAPNRDQWDNEPF